jgi:pyruvate,water dikinase
MMSAPAEPDFAVVLDGSPVEVALVGGKGASLARLVALGAPVPPTGVVTTSAYRRVAEDAALRSLVDELRRAPPPNAADMAADQDRVDAAFAAVPVPDDLATAIRDLAERIGGDGTLAVRSSATAEDESSASFAGQYRTMLHVEPVDAVDAVRRCWASLWHPVARSYRRYRGVDDAGLAMAVLLMPMLQPDRAGVVFTEDPVRAGSLRIEVVEGLGESLVSGARTPDVVRVDRSELARDTLESPVLEGLASLALRLEDAFGVPLDIEWAAEGDRLHVLQARPITTDIASAEDDGFDTADAAVHRHTTAGIAEMLPGVQPPRLWELNSWLLEEAFRDLFTGLGGDVAGLAEPHALIGRFRGRAALDLDRLEGAIASLPGGSVTELERQYFGAPLDPGPAAAADDEADDADGTGLGHGLRTLRARRRAFQTSEAAIQAIEEVVAGEPDLTELDDPALLALRARVVHLAGIAAAAEVAVAAVAAASYRGLERFLRAHLGDADGIAAVQALTATDRAGHRGRRALSLGPLGAELASAPELAAARECDTWDDARRALDSTTAGQEFAGRFECALRRAGSTSEFGGSTWDRVPDMVWPMVRRLPSPRATDVADERARARTDIERLLASEALAARRRFGGGLVDVRRWFLRREAGDAAAFLERREETKAALLVLGGVLWRIDRELGRRLVARRAIDEVDDVDLLTSSEVERSLGGAPPAPAVVGRRRRRHAAGQLEPPLPESFRGRPGRTSALPLTGDLFVGWPGSPGRYEGRARVVGTPAGAGLRRGDVLIAHATDASWLPLFHLAGAVVVEEGGPLSHASILARELGMPAVLHVPGIVDRIRDQPESVVTVDGTTGQVAIRSAARRSSTARTPARTGPTEPRMPLPPRPPSPTPWEYRHVFVTGLIGAGALMSVAIGVTQAISNARTRERIRRHARARARALAAATLNGFDAATVGEAGLRRRGYYVWLGVLSALLAAVGMAWSLEEYADAPRSALAVVVLGVGLSSAGTLVVLSSIGFTAVARWPTVSSTARRLTPPRVHDRFGPNEAIGTKRAALVAAMAITVGVIAWMVAEAEGQLRVVDEWIFDAVGAGSDDTGWWHPGVLDSVFRKEIMMPLAVVLTIASRRCRPLLVAYPLVIVGGGLTHLLLQHFVVRERPQFGTKPGFDDSFPGGHANELTIMLGLIPVVVYVLTRRRWLRIALEIACALVLAVLLVDQLRIGDHWPTDNLAGFLIGLSMVLVARGIAHEPALHDRCDRCPAQRRGEVPT